MKPHARMLVVSLALLVLGGSLPAQHREKLGADHYTIRYRDFAGIVLNSGLIANPGARQLDLLKSAGVTHIFAGHLHRNSIAKDGDLEMVVTGPVGRPLGSDPSGIRVVIVRSTGIEHRYYGLGSIPNAIQMSVRAEAKPAASPKPQEGGTQ